MKSLLQAQPSATAEPDRGAHAGGWLMAPSVQTGGAAASCRAQTILYKELQSQI